MGCVCNRVAVTRVYTVRLRAPCLPMEFGPRLVTRKVYTLSSFLLLVVLLLLLVVVPLLLIAFCS